MEFKLTLNGVSRRTFNRICDRMDENEKAFAHMYVHYDGDAGDGVLTVTAYRKEDERAFKRTMRVVMEEYLRNY